MIETKPLSAARRRAARALAAAPSFEEAAECARVRPETLWRWLGQDPAFREAVGQQRRLQKEASCIAAEALLSIALTALENALQDETLEPEVRVEAARATFDVAIQLYKLTALESRLTALERARTDDGDTPAGGALQVSAASAAKRAA